MRIQRFRRIIRRNVGVCSELHELVLAGSDAQVGGGLDGVDPVAAVDPLHETVAPGVV